MSISSLLSQWELAQPLKVRNYRLLWVGSVIAMIGSNLTMIAFPWLVLKLTGDSLAMGAVLAVTGIPRALFMIFGGALTDRYSARIVMICSSWVRMILLLLLAYLVFSHAIEMWMVYIIAFIFGIVDAFAWPASTAILPKLVPVSLLPPANALMQGFSQISVMLGPVLAGLLIAGLSTGGGDDSADLPGIAMVFFIDGCGFIVSVISLTMIRLESTPVTDQLNAGSVFNSIIEGFSAMWNDLPVRLMVLVFSVFALFYRGPYMVGIPVLCNERFAEGALAFGMISSAFGVGALLGIIAAGSLTRPPEHWYGKLLLLDLLVLGASFFVYAVAPGVEWVMLAAAVGGLLDGYMMVLLISWMQARIPGHLLGRVMGVTMFFNSGLAPISYALAGAAIRISLEGVFWTTGVILVLLAVAGLSAPVIRSLGMRPTAQSTA
jgi:MFS family permease